MNKTKSIVWGIIVIFLGAFWGLKEAGIIHDIVFFDGWWTLFIIIPSFISLITDKNKTGSLIGLAVGGLLLSNYYVDLSQYKHYLLPALVVLVGAGIIINAVFTKNKADANTDGDGFNVQMPAPDPNGNQEYYATFSGQDLKYQNGFAGGKFVATFGAMKLDIREADIVPNCVINTSATFGGVDIHVPQDVRVVVKSNSLFGGVSDKSNKNLPPDAKTIYINASNLFGGTDIK